MTERKARRLPRLTMAFALLALAAASPASGTPLLLDGSGTVTPGIHTTGCSLNSYTFDATIAAGPGAVIGAGHFDGSSTLCESLGAGLGSGTFSGATTCRSVTYTRLYFEMRFSGTSCALTCLLVPTSWNPVTTYQIACATALENSR